jgi:hypothetical protein
MAMGIDIFFAVGVALCAFGHWIAGLGLIALAMLLLCLD